MIFCDTWQAWTNCWFSLSLSLPHARNGSRPISQLQESFNARGSNSPAFLGAGRCLVLWPFVSEAEKCPSISCWNGWTPNTPEQGDFAQRSASAWHQQWLMGTLQSWAFKAFVFPWEGTIFPRPGLVLFVLPTTQQAENFQNPREKVEDFRIHFVFQCQLWNTQNILVEQKFPCNLMVACQEFWPRHHHRNLNSLMLHLQRENSSSANLCCAVRSNSSFQLFFPYILSLTHLNKPLRGICYFLGLHLTSGKLPAPYKPHIGCQ